MAKKKIGTHRPLGVHPTTVSSDGTTGGLINFLDIIKDEGERAKIVSKIVRDFQDSRDWRTSWHDKWISYYQQYRSYSPYYKSMPRWKSALYIPKTFELIEIIEPRMISAIFDSNPIMSAVAESSEFVPHSQMVEDLFDTRAWQMDLFMTQYTTFKELLVYGTAFQKVEYAVTREYEGPILIPKDIFDIYPDPRGSDIGNCRYVCERNMKHIEELKLLEDQEYLTGVKDILAKGSGSYFSHFDRLRSVGYPQNNTDWSDDYHETIEFWGKYHHEETDEWFDIQAIIVDRKHLVKMAETPYFFADESDEYFYALKPYVKYLDVPIPHEMYGIGECEVMQDIQNEINDTRNAVGDALQFAVSPTFTALKGTFDPKDRGKFLISPGMINDVNIPDGIKSFEVPMQWLAGYDSMERSKQDARDVTGIQMILSGGDGSIRTTASEKIIQKDEASQRIKMKNMINSRNMSKAAGMVIAMDMQFTDEQVSVMRFGATKAAQYQKLSPMDLKWRGKFTVEPAALYGSKAMRFGQLMQFTELMSKLGELAPGSVQFKELIRRIAESMDIDPRNLINDAPPAAPPQLKILPGGNVDGLPSQEMTVPPAGDQEIAAMGPGAGMAAGPGGKQAFGKLSSMFA